MRTNRTVRPWPWLVGAAILCGPMLPGCGGASQTTGPVENAPKESPVLSSKDSMNEFMNNRKAASSKK